MLHGVTSRGARLRIKSYISSARGFHSIPLVDISAHTNVSGGRVAHSARKEATDKLHRACKDVGFAYITGHGISNETLHKAREHGRQFFNLPDQIKQSIHISRSKSYRGYQKVFENVTQGSEDVHEGLDLQKEYLPGHRLYGAHFPLLGANQWPDESHSPGFRSFFESYILQMTQVSRTLMRAMAPALGVEENFFDEPFEDGHWFLRVIGYPPAEGKSRATESDFGCGEHTDYGCLTLVNQDLHCTGLEVRNKAGEWIPAEPVEGALVMNIGDMLSIWTNKQYVSTPHRVLRSTKSSRISVPFFYEPNFDCAVSPIGSKEGESVVYGDHLMTKLTSNFKYHDGLKVATV